MNIILRKLLKKDVPKEDLKCFFADSSADFLAFADSVAAEDQAATIVFSIDSKIEGTTSIEVLALGALIDLPTE